MRRIPANVPVFFVVLAVLSGCTQTSSPTHLTSCATNFYGGISPISVSSSRALAAGDGVIWPKHGPDPAPIVRMQTGPAGGAFAPSASVAASQVEGHE